MSAKVIEADTIDEAATEVLEVLKEKANTTRSLSSRDNVFYFDGWDGLGASAVLRNIAQRLSATTPDGKRALADLEFDQVIHIDCSMWESRRALQKAVAEQLQLPDEVMKMFDRQDEEDDFRGVAEGSRAELQQVAWEIYQHTQKANRRLLVIFHNGSSEEIDLATCCGLSLSGYSTSKVLWTFQGRYRIKPRTKVDKAMKSAGTTDAFLSAGPRRYGKEEQLWSYLVLEEAAEVAEACKVTAGSRDIINKPTQVAECFLYMLDLCCKGSQSIDYDLATHGANYWVCDRNRIIHQLQHEERDVNGGDKDDGLWRAVDALQQQMLLDMDHHQYLTSPHLAMFINSKPYWTSPTCGFTRIPAGAIHNGDMFQHCSNKLHVLKLSRCTFNFQSPPFQCCQSLKFLWLDRCQHTGINNTDGEGKEEDVRRCFQRLWVLDVRDMHCVHILSGQMMDYMTQLRELNVMRTWKWDMGQLQGRLPNIRKLRVAMSSVTCSCSEENLFSEMNKMEVLEFSGNNIDSFCITINNSSCLETVNIVEFGGFKRISFKGCTKLKNLIFSGRLYHVCALDISGTAVKTLDLTGITNLGLHELYLLDCKKLCAILWPPEDIMKRDLDKLCIDTTRSAPTAQSREEIAKRGTTAATIGTSAATTVLHRSRPTNEFPWYISVRDARLLMSLEAVFGGLPYTESRKLYLEVSPTPSPTVFAAGCRDEGIKSGSRSELQRQPAPAIYAAPGTTAKCDGDATGIMWMWSCPDVPDLHETSCYMHIQETNTITVPEFVIYCAKILHVRGSMSITVFPSGTESQGSEWVQLEWCRIERCPRLEDVFTLGEQIRGLEGRSYSMKTFWASQLRKASCIWKYSEPCGVCRTFEYLVFLHLDCCPRLVHVLPLSLYMIDRDLPESLSQLETLEITWCGDLREVFPLEPYAKRYVKQQPQPVTLDFPGLKRIHLHELPRLHSICGGVRMSAPNLETIKIRGCWSLKRLPDVGGGDKAVECDCEKEWWDRLEWDDGSQVTRYKPIHSRYYKKTLLRSSVLR
ncbi:hypothetical protein SEVIR_2G062400v4 [Setaria viridis]|uniref:Disease resistance protein At4g27190-like leucine-rich repeats domain-containing protein n=1 Tax=Setaria viridis TaxID=4556 RepID=A0A4U6VM62_SETVI|nr:uncharacterized protein LOC117843087 [Setaria viridis]TKW30811.1 hypothetical protein SEVIR_2G062400v2 [Setaria viridis]